MIYLACLSIYLCTAISVFSITPWVRLTALSLGQTDLPSSRKVHRQPMVRLGGIGIFVGFALGLLWLARWGSAVGAELTGPAIALLLGGLAFFLLGLADDCWDLSPLLRLACQFLIAGAVWSAGLRLDLGLILPLEGSAWACLGGPYLSCALTVLWLAGVTNAVNWIDGLDGLAAGISAIGAACLITISLVDHQPLCLVLAVALLGSLCGFLRYNFNPAQIFMGDSGSYFVGFMLAALCLLGPLRGGSGAGLALAGSVVALPLIDMVSVIWTRLSQGRSPFQADNSHLHHRLLGLGLSHRSCVEAMYLLALLLSGFLLMASFYISLRVYLALWLAAFLMVTVKLLTSKSIDNLLSLNADLSD